MTGIGMIPIRASMIFHQPRGHQGSAPRPEFEEILASSGAVGTTSLTCNPSYPLLVAGRERIAQPRRIPSVLRPPEIDLGPPVVILKRCVVRIVEQHGRPFHEAIVECLRQIDLGPLEL